MENNTYEQEIDLKDLMFAVFRKWRPIILAAVILGILLGGYKVGSGLMKQRSSEFVQTAQDDYQSDISMYEKTKSNYEREIENLTANLEFQEEYYESSVLMQISPYDKCVASADIFVKTELPEIIDGKYIMVTDRADSVLRAYSSFVTQEAGLKTADRMGLTPNNFRELVTVEVDYESNIMNIAVAYLDEKGAGELLEGILSELKDAFPVMEESLGEHQMMVLNQNVASVTDLELLNEQKRNADMLVTLQKTLQERETALEELKEPLMPAALSNMALLKSGVKYGILGGVLGAFMAVFMICVVFLMSDKLNSEKELKNRFGLKVLGVFAQKRKKRAFSGIDNWLDRLEGKSGMAEERVYEVLSVNVENYKEGSSKLMLTGTVNDELLQDIAKKLSPLLKGTILSVASNMNESAATLKLLPECDAVILVEERGNSKFPEIEQELEVIRNLKKNVIGCIVL